MQRYMRMAAVAGLWIGVVGAGIGFVLPWATLDVRTSRLTGQLGRALGGTGLEGLTRQLGGKISRVTLQFKRGAETITGDLPDLSNIPKQVNGPDIPQVINRRDNAVAIALAEMLTGQGDIGKKSYAVYLVPGLALLLAALVTGLQRVPLVCWGSAALSAAVAGAGFWKLLTTNTQSLLIAITIGPGLWLSLWAYAGMAASSTLLGVLGRRDA